MNRTIRDLLIAAAGLLTSAATALILWFCLHFLHLAIYSYASLFIPVGAIACGMAAGSGYYLAAKELNHKATNLVLTNLLAMSVSTYFVVQYLQYLYTDVDGQHASDMVPFSSYLDIVIRHSRIGLLPGVYTGELGIFGYLAVALPIGGFALGGYFLFSKLRLRPYCDRCETYLEPGLVDSRYTVLRQEMDALFSALKNLYRHNKIGEAVAYFSKWGLETPPRGCRLSTDIVVCPCPKCGGQWVHFQGRQVVNDDYQPVGRWYVSGFSPEPLFAIGGQQSSAAISI